MPTALVTGGNRGLGLEACRQLALEGYAVLLASRDRTQGEEAARSIGKEVRAVTLDVSDPTSVRALALELEREPPLYALVNNAGASFKGFDASVAERTIDTNYRGAVRVTDALLPRLSPSANIVMVSSGMGELSHVAPALAKRLLDPALGRAALEALVDDFVSAVRSGGDLGGWPKNAYSVSKVALNAFTRILTRELGGSGPRANAVCPGWVRTRMGGSAASRSVDQGASGIVWAATLPASGPRGGFFRDAKAIDW